MSVHVDVPHGGSGKQRTEHHQATGSDMWMTPGLKSKPRERRPSLNTSTQCETTSGSFEMIEQQAATFELCL